MQDRVELTVPIILWYLLMRTISISSSYHQMINCTCNWRSSWTRPHSAWQPIMQWIWKRTLALNMCVSVCCVGCKVAEANYAMQYAWPGMHEGGGSTNASGLTTLFIRTLKALSTIGPSWATSPPTLSQSSRKALRWLLVYKAMRPGHNAKRNMAKQEGKRKSNLNVPLAISSKAVTTTVTLSVLAACQVHFVPLLGMVWVVKTVIEHLPLKAIFIIWVDDDEKNISGLLKRP